jgi:mono/diheme cytochrome c family protein
LNTQKQIVLIVALLFIFVGGCAAYTAIDLPIRAEDQSQWTKDQSLERGALLFANNCRTCHGNRGQGLVGPQLLANEATNFQNQDPLILKANRDLIRRTLYCGRAGTLMPAWLNTNGGSLNAVQIEHLIDFITAPIKQSESGDVESEWWDAAEGFAHNLNDEVSVLVGGDTLGTIAKAHGIGPKELAAANNRPTRTATRTPFIRTTKRSRRSPKHNSLARPSWPTSTASSSPSARSAASPRWNC